MTADTFAILCTIAPFAILLIGVTHPGLRKKHLRKKFTVIRNSSVKSKHKKRVTKSAKPKYKLKDLNNVDLTKGFSYLIYFISVFSDSFDSVSFFMPLRSFCFGGGNSIK